MSHSIMVRGLVLSMSYVSAKPFWCDYRIGSYMIRIKWWMSFWESRCLFSYKVAQSGTRGHFDMTVGLVPTRLDVSACLSDEQVRCKWWAFSQMIVVEYYHAGECKGCAFLTWCWMCSSHGQMWVLGVPFWYDYRIGSYTIRYKCWAVHSELG